MWTAEQARKVTKESRYKDEIHAIDQTIINATGCGDMQTIFYDRISDYVKDKLEGLGYQVTIQESPWTDNGYITKISWLS